MVGVSDEQQCPVHSHTESRVHQERQSTQTSPGVSIIKPIITTLGRGYSIITLAASFPVVIQVVTLIVLVFLLKPISNGMRLYSRILAQRKAVICIQFSSISIYFS